MPYALQLMAQFIELDNASSDDIMEICLSQDLDSENLAGLVRLIQTVLPIAPETFIHVLPYALTISKRLVSSPRTEKQCNRTVKFQKALLLFFSLLVVVKGGGYLEESINSIQENLFLDFLHAIWIPSLKSIMGENHERKLAAVAATKVLGDLKYHQNPQAATRWGKMLNSVISLVLCPEKTEDVGDSENSLIIHNAIRKEDHAEGIKDPKEHLVHAVSHLSRLDHPGMLQSIIAENLDQPNKVAWDQLCTAYKASCGF
ncbi:exportin-2-like [Brassica napus]|uniref:exportin-2-like n=1 Tax=Brassica napus TaxID=3708 RepID=UPI0006AAA21B|nr:exportin-2-like [Brassica napus]